MPVSTSRLEAFSDGSAAKGKLKPGDIVTAITLEDLTRFPSIADLRDRAGKAYDKGKTLTLVNTADGHACRTNCSPIRADI